MQLLRYTKIALLIVILAEEIRNARDKDYEYLITKVNEINAKNDKLHLF